MTTRRCVFKRQSFGAGNKTEPSIKILLTTTLRSCKMFKYNDAHRVSIHDNLISPTNKAQCRCSLRRLLVQACASRVGDLVFYFSLPSAEQCPQKAGEVIQLKLERSYGTCALMCCFPGKRLLNQAPRSDVKLKSVVRFLFSFTSCCSDVRSDHRYRCFCVHFLNK